VILDAHGQPIGGDRATLDETELLAAMAAELRALEAEDEPMVVALHPVTAVQLAGLVQLAIRHPDIPDNLRETAARFLESVREYFLEAPAVRAVLERGDDPSQDVAP
jgi:hypothetical protein